MYISLRCAKCRDILDVPVTVLYSIWKKAYDKMSPEKQARARVKTDVRCHCGAKETYDSPMFNYVFQLLFTELVRKEKV